MAKLFRYKMILFGSSGVGKSSLVRRYVQNIFEEDYVATLGYNVFEKRINHEDISISLIIYDVGGQEKFSEIREKYAKGAAMALIIYDVTNGESFNALPSWKKDLHQFAGEIPFIIVGNKVDLKADRQVLKDEAKQVSLELKALDFFETSAKTGEGVEEAFNQLAIMTYKSRYS